MFDQMASEMKDRTVDAVTCFISDGTSCETARSSAQNNQLAPVGHRKTSCFHRFKSLWYKPAPADRISETNSSDEPELKAFNPEDYEYTMFLQFVDPAVEKEYLQNAKIKVCKEEAEREI